MKRILAILIFSVSVTGIYTTSQSIGQTKPNNVWSTSAYSNEDVKIYQYELFELSGIDLRFLKLGQRATKNELFIAAMKLVELRNPQEKDHIDNVLAPYLSNSTATRGFPATVSELLQTFYALELVQKLLNQNTMPGAERYLRFPIDQNQLKQLKEKFANITSDDSDVRAELEAIRSTLAVAQVQTDVVVSTNDIIIFVFLYERAREPLMAKLLWEKGASDDIKIKNEGYCSGQLGLDFEWDDYSKRPPIAKKEELFQTAIILAKDNEEKKATIEESLNYWRSNATYATTSDLLNVLNILVYQKLGPKEAPTLLMYKVDGKILTHPNIESAFNRCVVPREDEWNKLIIIKDLIIFAYEFGHPISLND